MILHLLWDEKITPRIIKTFEEVFPNNNEYIFWYAESNSQHFTHEGERCHIIRNNDELPNIDYNKFTKVIIHGLDIKKIQLCKEKIKPDIPIYWILWGAELYNWLLYPKGYKLYYKSHPPFNIKNHIYLILKRFGFLSKNDKYLLNFFEKRKVSMICSEREWSLFKSYYPKQTKNLNNIKDYFYYPIDEILGENFQNTQAKGNVILVGNSASWTNNHEYVFKYLKKINVEDKEIVTPLSYGGNEEYRSKVEKIGKKWFKHNYTSIRQFLPLAEYNILMTKAEICIFGSWRQEAFGNIVIALYLGSKVFLSEKSPLYRELKSQGLVIFKLEEITQEVIDNPLNYKEKKNNRDILLQKNSWNRLKSLTYQIFKE